MAIRPVLLVPDPRLKQACSVVEGFDAELHTAIADLEDTRLDSPGCVGIAAPQIGILQRTLVSIWQ